MIDPAFIAKTDKRQAPTFVVGFGDGVRSAVENGVDAVDYEWGAREAAQWSYDEAYLAGFRAGADWYCAERRG